MQRHIELDENQYKCTCNGCSGPGSIDKAVRSRKGQYFRRLKRLANRKKHNGR